MSWIGFTSLKAESGQNVIHKKRKTTGRRELTEPAFIQNQSLKYNIMNLFDKISEDIKAAMKARDKVRLETLRNIKKVFLEAKTAPGADDTLEDADALKIIQKLAKQGKETAKTYEDNGRNDLAEAEKLQVAVLEEYLPQQLSETEVEQRIQAIIQETGASSMKDMGRVMGVATKQLAGIADGRLVSEVVKRLLAQ